MSEAEIEEYLVERVRALGGECRKVRWIGRRGAPDRVVMLSGDFDRFGSDSAPGRAIWIELKAPGAKPRPHQLREHERMRRMGQQVEVVDSFERVDEVIG